MDERNNGFDFDFLPIGQAIKKAREGRGMTREQLSGIIGFAPRHLQAIENEGQYPSIALLLTVGTPFLVAVIRTEPSKALSDVIVSLLPDLDTLTAPFELAKE